MLLLGYSSRLWGCVSSQLIFPRAIPVGPVLPAAVAATLHANISNRGPRGTTGHRTHAGGLEGLSHGLRELGS